VPAYDCRLCRRRRLRFVFSSSSSSSPRTPSASSAPCALRAQSLLGCFFAALPIRSRGLRGSYVTDLAADRVRLQLCVFEQNDHARSMFTFPCAFSCLHCHAVQLLHDDFDGGHKALCPLSTAWFAWISAFISFCCSTISLMRLFDHIVCSHSQRVRFAKLRCVGFTVPSSTSAVPKTSSTTLLIRSHQSGQC
jgi:hypothetical protein